MSKYFKETMRNAKEFYSNAGCSVVAKMINEDGFIGSYEMSDRSYFFTMKIEEKPEVVYLEMSPCIHCYKEAVGQVTEYMAQINEKFMACDFRVSPNGKVYIHTEQRFDDGPISVNTFRAMEIECVERLDAFATVLDKLANLKLITPEEADVDKVLSKHNEKMDAILEEAFARIEKELENEEEFWQNREADASARKKSSDKDKDKDAGINGMVEKERKKRRAKGDFYPVVDIRFEDILDGGSDEEKD